MCILFVKKNPGLPDTAETFVMAFRFLATSREVPFCTIFGAFDDVDFSMISKEQVDVLGC